MKKIFLVIIGITLSIFVSAQSPRVDTVAVMILDRMASVIGELNSCSFTLHTSYDEADPAFGFVKHSGSSEVYLDGPDKMLVHSYGDKGHRGFWYNGFCITYYSFDENNYAVIPAPDNTIDMIDTINENYGIEFPAADFFYPTFTDDVLDYFDDIIYLGKKNLNDKECFQVLASGKDMSVQFWFANDAYNLPQKFIIIYKNEGNKQYEATFTDWQLNPVIPSTIFEFMPPPMAREISILPKSN